MMDMQEWRSAWDRAQDATDTRRTALSDMGAVETQVMHLRPMVNRGGTAWVDVGQLPADLAARLADVIRVGSLDDIGPS
ncbi:hypothetical protein [Streptomyces xanthochromogenes]|uniref:hypothetical protein n=1 Tax=Streptomyces xanthochromogenes TaxID=67384 RepID=UPI00341A7C26